MTTGREIDRLIDIAADQVRKGHSVDEAVDRSSTLFAPIPS
jgi:hypothetical protein